MSRSNFVPAHRQLDPMHTAVLVEGVGVCGHPVEFSALLNSFDASPATVPASFARCMTPALVTATPSTPVGRPQEVALQHIFASLSMQQVPRKAGSSNQLQLQVVSIVEQPTRYKIKLMLPGKRPSVASFKVQLLQVG